MLKNTKIQAIKNTDDKRHLIHRYHNCFKIILFNAVTKGIVLSKLYLLDSLLYLYYNINSSTMHIILFCITSANSNENTYDVE